MATNRILDEVTGALRVLATPSCWVQVNRYSRLWDSRLRKAAEQHKFTNVAEFSARLGPYKLWIENYPYGSFRPYDRPDIRPRRITILRLGDKLIREAISEIETEAA